VRFKLDENIATSAAAALVDAGHDVDTVADEGLTGADDPAVLRAATHEGRLLVSLDRGLGDVRAYPPGTHAGVLVLRLDRQSPSEVTGALRAIVETVDVAPLSRAVAVWRNGTLRVRLPPDA
jgi:predicted nuclease of predicted toxin-antitoxin system